MHLLIDQVDLILSRLERISVDSPLAHRASGYRGSLLKWRERLEQLNNKHIPLSEEEYRQAGEVLQQCYHLLEKAARERLGSAGKITKCPHGNEAAMRAKRFVTRVSGRE